MAAELRVEDGMLVLYIDGQHDTNFGFGANLTQILERVGKPREGTPTTILADAVNQLAMVMEILVPAIGPRGVSASDQRKRLIAIRESVAALIPE